MLTKTTALLSTAIFAIGAGTALAQSTGGSPADPNSNANRQPAPSAGKPSDPAAGAKPSAQKPTSPAGTGSATTGTSSGETGASSSGAPAGSAADPNSAENRQPGPSTKPSDPAAGSSPSARQPTAP
jgi:hypothetical protein